MKTKIDISAEQRIARLEAQLELLSCANEQLIKDNASLEAKMATLAAKATSLETSLATVTSERDQLIEQIKLINQRHYGSKSEKVVPGQLFLFNAMEFEAEPDVPEPCLPEVVEPKPRKRGGKRKISHSNLETVVIRHELAADERICPECKSELEEMNVEVSYTVKMVPAHLIVERHERVIYRCPKCSKAAAEDGETPAVIKRAQMPKMPLSKSFASPSLIAYILNGKYINSLPLYRMEYDFKCLGVEISRQNMANWTMRCYEKWFSIIRARLKSKLLQGDIIHADETRCQVLKEPNREAKQQSRMWLFCAPVCDEPVYVYEYHPTRCADVAATFLEGWSGTLTTDGYEPYFKLGPKISNTACLVHVRRKFAEIVKTAGGDAKAEAAGSVALKARKLIDAMFAIDSKFDKMEPQQRKIHRNLELRPLMEQFAEWARFESLKAVPGMALYKALNYAVKYWPYVMNVLNDGRLELDNNVAERAIRPFAVGRKNYLFSDTPRGAEASAGIYSVMITAKMNGLNPRKYVEWLLTEMPNTEGNLNDIEFLDTMMPWSKTLPQSLYLSPKAAEEAAKMIDEPLIDIDPEIFSEEG